MSDLAGRLRRLEGRAPAEPVVIACFDYDGKPLNEAARQMTAEERAAARHITLTIDRANPDDGERHGDAGA